MSWPKFVSPSPKIWTWKQIETRKNRTQFFEDIMYITKLMVESIMEKKKHSFDESIYEIYQMGKRTMKFLEK